jgi:hypothetical protein
MISSLKVRISSIVAVLSLYNKFESYVGLRLLEACIDTLAPAFLDPILERHKAELVMAMWRHVKPPPYAHGHAAIKVLGKLAGRGIDLERPPDRLVCLCVCPSLFPLFFITDRLF